MKYATVEINKNFKKIYPKLNYLKKNHFNYTGVSLFQILIYSKNSLTVTKIIMES